MRGEITSKEELRRRALELREKGYSYRHIARKLGLGNFANAYYLINPKGLYGQRIEGVNEKISMLEDSLKRIEARVEGLEKHVKRTQDLSAALTAIDSRLRKAESEIAQIKSQISNFKDYVSSLHGEIQGVKDEVQRIKGSVESWQREVKTYLNEIRKSQSNIEANLKLMKDALNKLEEFQFWTIYSINKRIRGEEYKCRYIDKDGYCTLWEWPPLPKYTRPESKGGKTVYRLNVQEIIYICSACPAYKPRK